LIDGTYIDPSHGRLTVAEWAPSWSAAQGHLKESTRVRYDGLLRTHVLPRWGKVPLAKVQHADIAIWVGDLQRSGLAASTVRQAFRVFSLMLSMAVRDGRLPKNPADGVRLPRAAKKEKRFLSHAEVESLAQAAGDHGAEELSSATGWPRGMIAKLLAESSDPRPAGKRSDDSGQAARSA